VVYIIIIQIPDATVNLNISKQIIYNRRAKPFSMFEQIYAAAWIKKGYHAIFVGFIYAIIGIFISVLMFPNYAGIASLAFVSALLIPSFNSFLKTSEIEISKARTFSVSRLYSDHREIIKASLLLFLGIFLAYLSIGLLFNPFMVNLFFRAQLSAGFRGAALDGGLFLSILKNNLLVFAVCFFISLTFGAGAIIFLVWNASVWGIVLSHFVHQSIAHHGGSPVIMFLILILPILPHLITEAFAYVSAAIVGGIVSKAVIGEKVGSERFRRVLTDALLIMLMGLLLVIIGATIEVLVL
jgi:uncharacterized membrane protein SpoIIM required for sporulation